METLIVVVAASTWLYLCIMWIDVRSDLKKIKQHLGIQ